MEKSEIDLFLAPVPEILTAEEVAELFRVNLRSIQRWAKEGRIPALRVGRNYRFAKADIKRLMLMTSTPSG